MKNLYIITAKGPSQEDYVTHVSLGYHGSYERYEEMAKRFEGARLFICGDLGPHCTDCAAPSDVLCDYPVGEGKTCDRPMCGDHANHVSTDTDYCRDHFIMWQEYLASARGYDVLHNVTPIPVEPVRDVPALLLSGRKKARLTIVPKDDGEVE